MKNQILFLFLFISTGIQAQKMIHELPAKTNVDSTNWLFLTGNPTSGKLYKITAANLRDSIAPATDTTSLSNRIDLKLNATDTASLSTRIDSKQATLVSGTNLKTVNGNTLLGSGDLVIAGGGSTDGDSSWYIVTDYGADKTGVADATAEIQAAIDAAEITGGIVYIPRGIYKVTATLTVREPDVTIMGEGRVSELRATGDYGNVLDVAPTVEPSVGGEFSHIKLSDFYISTTVSRTSGYGIFTNWTEQLIVHNVYIGEIHRDNSVPKFYNGLSLQNQSNCAISGTIITARNYGIYVTGTSKPGTPFTGNNFDGVLSGNNIITGDHTYTSPGSVGIYIAGGTGGFQIEESNIAFYYNNIKVDRSFNGVINRELFINHAFAADNSDGAGIVIDTNALQLFQMTGGWSAGAGRGTGTPKHGIYINDTNATLRTVITGGTVYANEGSGIYAGGGLISITGVQMWQNSEFDIVLGPNITSASITGGRASTLDDNSAITAIIKGVDGLADNPPASGTPPAGSTTELQYNNAGSFGATSSLKWDSGLGLVARGYLAMDYPITGGYGLIGRNQSNLDNLFQFGFNAQGQYGGTINTTSGSQVFIYNFQEALGTPNNYYWGFNNTGENFWGSSNTLYSVRIQQPRAGSIPLSILGVSGQTEDLFNVTKNGGSAGGVITVTASGNVGFGEVSPNASALIEMESTTQGFLPPRMTKAQRDAISSPVFGLTIIQTDNTPGIRVFNGTNWMRFTETVD